MSTLTDICTDYYIIFFVKVLNEEDALKWLSEEEKLTLDVSSCNFDNLRKLRTRKQRVLNTYRKYCVMIYDKPPALILYIR